MEIQEPISILLVVAVGIVAGFFNVIAGGGSLLSLPALDFIGLELGVANATNRVSILCQNLSAIFLYQKHREIKWSEIFPYIVPAVIGAIIGTLSAVYMPQKAFRILAAVSISTMGILLASKPKMWENPTGNPLSPHARIAAMFAIGIYGGFLQAGVGFLIIWVVVGGCKKDLKEANITKVVVVAIYSVVSIVLFASFSMVRWTAAAALALGSIIGGNLGAHFNLRGDKKWIHWILTVAVFISAAKIFFDTFN